MQLMVCPCTFQPSWVFWKGRYATFPHDDTEVPLSVTEPGQAVVAGDRADPGVLPEAHRQGPSHRLCTRCK